MNFLYFVSYQCNGVYIRSAQPPGHGSDPTCDIVSSSLRGSPQVWKFGCRRMVALLPSYQISGCMGSPRSCVLDGAPDPSKQGQVRVAPSCRAQLVFLGPETQSWHLGGRRGGFGTLLPHSNSWERRGQGPASWSHLARGLAPCHSSRPWTPKAGHCWCTLLLTSI